WGDALRNFGVGQALRDLLAREVDVDAVLEGDDHLRETKRGDRSLDQHVRDADERALDRNRHLLFDLLRRLSRIERDHHDLDARSTSIGSGLVRKHRAYEAETSRAMTAFGTGRSEIKNARCSGSVAAALCASALLGLLGGHACAAAPIQDCQLEA